MQHWVNQEERRFYTIMVTQDLFGDWVLIRAWGGLDNNKGGQKSERFGCEQEALDAIEEIKKRRK